MVYTDPVRRKILAERESMHGTGVKGVLADYKTHLKLQSAQSAAEAQARRDMLYRMATGKSRSQGGAQEEEEPSAGVLALASLERAISRQVPWPRCVWVWCVLMCGYGV